MIKCPDNCVTSGDGVVADERMAFGHQEPLDPPWDLQEYSKIS